MKIISVCPEYSSELVRHHIFEKLPGLLSILIECPDHSIRRLTGEILTHLLIVHINYFDLELNAE